MALSSKQRESYLHSMGIQSWSERLPIQKNVSSVIGLEKKIQHQKIDIKITPPQKLSTLESATKKNEAQVLLQASDACRFNLAFLAFSDLLIISELPLHEHNAITPPQLRLLKSIRLSLGYPPIDPTQMLVMNWPMVENNKIDQSEEAAFEAVQAQLKKQMEKHQPTYLILMGVAAVRHVLGLSKSFDEVRGQLIANEFLRAAVTYSVNEILKVPSLKSSVWKDLQAIRRSLI